MPILNDILNVQSPNSVLEPFWPDRLLMLLPSPSTKLQQLYLTNMPLPLPSTYRPQSSSRLSPYTCNLYGWKYIVNYERNLRIRRTRRFRCHIQLNLKLGSVKSKPTAENKILLYLNPYLFGLVLYRVIRKSLRDFRTRLRNNQDRHGRKEHISR